MSTTSTQQIIQGAILGVNPPQTLFANPPNQVAQIMQMSLYNSDSTGTHVVTLYLTASSGTPALADQVALVFVPALQTVSVYQVIKLVVPAGGTIQASADLGGVVVMKASANIISG